MSKILHQETALAVSSCQTTDTRPLSARGGSPRVACAGRRGSVTGGCEWVRSRCSARMRPCTLGAVRKL